MVPLFGMEGTKGTRATKRITTRGLLAEKVRAGDPTESNRGERKLAPAAVAEAVAEKYESLREHGKRARAGALAGQAGSLSHLVGRLAAGKCWGQAVWGKAES